MFDKLKLKSKAKDLAIADPAASPGQPPNKRQIYRNRNNFGVNIGACFVREKWIFHHLFPEGAETELDLVTKLVKQDGAGKTRENFEQFWSTFLNNDDWAWLQDHDVKSVRIPVGYWNIDTANTIRGTRFQNFGEVYQNSWSILVENFIKPAAAHNISVLLDLHALPSGANGNAHSGEKTSGDGEFWAKSDYQLQITKALVWATQQLQQFDNIAGIQIVNEADFADNNSKQARYYSAAINAIRTVDGSIPIVISDGWWADQWVKWVQSNQSDTTSVGVVIDSHLYRCFDDKDKAKSPQKITEDLENDVLTNLNDNGKGVDFIVGEYSCVLDQDSWNRDNAQNQRDDLVINYGKRQVDVLKQRAAFGTYFWTYKFESGNGGEWDFKTMTDKGAISNPLSLRGKQIPDQGFFEQKLNEVASNHENYWNGQNKNEKYEHERFRDGFTTGWVDSLEFVKFDGSTIGRIEAWKTARYAEHIKARGKSKYVWEWEQGFDAGVNEFIASVN